MRLCCQLDKIAGTASFTLRCRTNHAYPDNAISVSCSGFAGTYEFEEHGLGWSSQLQSSQTQETLNGSILNWCQDLQFENENRHWRLTFPGSDVRIFISGEWESLPGLVEVRQLPQGSPFYLAAKDNSELFKKWGAANCEGFRQIPVIKGLPDGWFLFYADLAKSDDLIRDKYPYLSLPTDLRLSFVGGLRADRRGYYFNFAPPQIFIRGQIASSNVYCNDTKLLPTVGTNNFQLPEGLPLNTRQLIQIKQGNDVLKRMSLYLVGDFPWKLSPTENRIGPLGERLQDNSIDSPYVVGLLVANCDVPDFFFVAFPIIEGRHKVFFIGKRPGQIIKWPEDPQPEGWSPVWAVTLDRRGEAEFCGSDITDSEPIEETIGSRSQIKRWKEVLYHSRKRIAPPSLPRVRALWQKYVGFARNV